MSRVTSHGRLHSTLIALSCFGFCAAATAQSAQANAPQTKPTNLTPAPAPPPTTPPAPVGAAPETATAPATANTQNLPVGGDPWAAAPASPSNPVAGAAGAPPPVYYVENVPGPNPEAEANAAPPEPRPAPIPMRLAIEEPPPPPVVRHQAPKTAFWLGARGGWWIPFGDLWGACNASGANCDALNFSDVASSGPTLELDIGARLGRNYNVYVLWERAQLGKGNGIDGYSQIRAETDYVAVGVRLSADPDDFGMVLDLAIGARRFRAVYEGKNELQLSQAPFESRLGVGVDIRLSRTFSLSPMVTLGLGRFGEAEWVTKTTVADAVPQGYDTLTHGWVTLQLGGHFDIAGRD